MTKNDEIAGNQATGTLKIIAMVLMFIDHAGKMLCGNMLEMRLLGRLAFPIYCWCIVVGFVHTRNVWKYLLRILVVGLISQPLYMAALNHSWADPNVFLTLALGICALLGIRGKKWLSEIWMPLLAMIFASYCGTDYGWKGVLLIILLYLAREKNGAIAAVMIAFSLFWGTTSQAITSLFGIQISLPGSSSLASMISPWLRLQTCAVLALPLILIPMKNIKLPRWIGYSIYPAHLILLIILEKILL